MLRVIYWALAMCQALCLVPHEHYLMSSHPIFTGTGILGLLWLQVIEIPDRLAGGEKDLLVDEMTKSRGIKHSWSRSLENVTGLFLSFCCAFFSVGFTLRQPGSSSVPLPSMMTIWPPAVNWVPVTSSH